jgi:AraC family transcriptional activator of tynA and feaB
MISANAQLRDGFDQWIHQINQICGAFNAQTLGDEFSGQIREH